MKTYTEYKLTDCQLQRLSALVHHRTPKYGMAMEALIRKKLVYINPHGDHQVNGNGCIAFEQARREGW